MVVSFLASNGTQAAPSTLFTSPIKEGMLVYDDTANALKLCDGTNWVSLIGAGGVTAAGTVAGAVQFRGSDGNLAADDVNFVWDDTNNRLGIGTATPTEKLEVNGNVKVGEWIHSNVADVSIRLRPIYNAIHIMNNAGSAFRDIAFSKATVYSQLQAYGSAGGPGYSFSGDTDTGFFYGGGDVIGMSTGGVERARLTNDGLGIGTTTPNASALLDVTSTSKGFLPPRIADPNGDVTSPAAGLMAYDSTDNTLQVYNGSAWITLADAAAGVSAAGNAGELQFNDGAGGLGADANLFWDDTNKRLGIGTTGPNSTLDVGGTSNAAFVQNLAAWGLNARSQGLIIMPEGSVVDDGAGNLTFGGTIIVMNPLSGSWIRVTPGTYALPSWAALWVPIPPTGARGTTVTPTVNSWVDADRNYDGRDRVVLAQRMSSGNIWTRFGVPANITTSTGGDWSTAGSNLHYDTGNVGIGTTSPGAKLHVSGATSGNQAGYLRLQDNGGNYRSLYMTNNNSTLGFSNGSNVAVLSNSGVWTNASDRRLKKNIHPTRYGIDAVMKLQPVDYDMKDSGESQVGLIAQDVQEVIPELVITPTTTSGNYTLSYGNLTAVAIKAIQDLKHANDNLREIVEQQGREIKLLKAAQ